MSPRSKEQNELIKDERREQLLQAALRVFSRRGLVATKIGDIASAAGLSHGLVYHYFTSKDEIFVELAQRAVMGSNGMVRQVESLPLDPMSKIRVMTDMTLKALDETADAAYFFFLMIQAYMSDVNPEEVKQLLLTSSEPSSVLRRIVAEGQAMGQIRPGDPNEYSLTYWAAIQGLAVSKIAMGSSFKMPSGEFLVRMFEITVQ